MTAKAPLHVVPVPDVVEDAQVDNPTSEVSDGYRQLIDNFKVPPGYEVWADGVYQVTGDRGPDEDMGVSPSIFSDAAPQHLEGLSTVTRRPVWLGRRGVHLQDQKPEPGAPLDEDIYELRYHTIDGEPQAQWVPRSYLFDRTLMRHLIPLQVPVRTGAFNEFEAYMDAAVHHNAAELGQERFSKRIGWCPSEKGKFDGFLFGNMWLTPDGATGHELALTPFAKGEQLKGFNVAGSFEDWRDKLREVLAYGAVSRWLLATVFAAPLGRVVNQRTFVVHHWGKSGIGKTAAMLLRHSAMGNPRAICMTFNRSPMSFIPVFQAVTDMPVGFDEGQARAGLNLSTFIYSLTLEQGRVVAAPRGGLVDTPEFRFRTVISTTAEQGIVSHDLGGQEARVIQLKLPALPSDEIARDVHAWIEQGQSYGWGGLLFVKHLLNLLQMPDALERLKTRRHEFTEIITEGAALPKGQASIFGTVALAQMLYQIIVFGMDKISARDQAIKDGQVIVDATQQYRIQKESAAEQVLHILRDHRAANRALWFDLNDEADRMKVMLRKSQEMVAVEFEAKNEVWMIPSEFERLVTFAKIPVDRAVTDLVEAGIMKQQRRSSRAAQQKIPRTIGQFSSTVYVLDRQHLLFGEARAPAPDILDER